MDLTYDIVANMYAEKGYKFYDTGKFNVNIFGIRRDLTVNLFNDTIGVAFRDAQNNPQLKTYPATTDPGYYWLKNKIGNIRGTFILAPGYYPKCWKTGQHKGQYYALVQAQDGLFKGWRDKDSDGVLDMSGPIYTDVKGLNLHTTSHLRGHADKVGAYSAACQVIQKTIHHGEFMGIIDWAKKVYSDAFSYALFDESALI